jgi:hypothetical protein
VVGGEPEQVARTAARLRGAGWTVRMSGALDAAALDAEVASAGATWRVLAGQGEALSADGRVLRLDPVPAPPAEGGAR